MKTMNSNADMDRIKYQLLDLMGI